MQLIPATSYRSDKRVHFQMINLMNGILTWFDCNSSFRNLRIILSDLRFHNKFQFVKYVLQPIFFFTAFGTERSQRALPVTAPASSISSHTHTKKTFKNYRGSYRTSIYFFHTLHLQFEFLLQKSKLFDFKICNSDFYRKNPSCVRFKICNSNFNRRNSSCVRF